MAQLDLSRIRTFRASVSGSFFTDAEGPAIDTGSRLIAEIAAAGTAPNILDCCAAPGGW